MTAAEAATYTHLLQTGLGDGWEVQPYGWDDEPAERGEVYVRRSEGLEGEVLTDAEDVYAFITNQAYNQYVNSPAESLAELEAEHQ